MQRVMYHAVMLISWGLCWSSSLSHMILHYEVSTHSRDSAQFSYIFGIYSGCVDATSVSGSSSRLRGALTRHEASRRPQLRRLTHDDQDIVGR